MARQPAGKKPKREPPIQFRLSADLMNLFAPFLVKYAVEQNEGVKCLLALALTNLDARCYGMVDEMAQSLGGTNAFVRACAHIDTAVNVAGKLRPEVLRDEVERLRFVLSTVRDFLESKGKTMRSGCPWASVASEPPQPAGEKHPPAFITSDLCPVATGRGVPTVEIQRMKRKITTAKKFQELHGPIEEPGSDDGGSGQQGTPDKKSQ